MSDKPVRPSELRQLETNELRDRVETAREELFKLRLNWHAGSLADPNQLRRKRHEIARLMTLLRERELAAELVAQEEEENHAE